MDKQNYVHYGATFYTPDIIKHSTNRVIIDSFDKDNVSDVEQYIPCEMLDILQQHGIPVDRSDIIDSVSRDID